MRRQQNVRSQRCLFVLIVVRRCRVNCLIRIRSSPNLQSITVRKVGRKQNSATVILPDDAANGRTLPWRYLKGGTAFDWNSQYSSFGVVMATGTHCDHLSVR